MIHKVVTHIPNVPDEWLSTNDWDSHRPMLWFACENTIGLIIEAGMGHGSTNLLHQQRFKRQVAHYDNSKEWIYNFKIPFLNATLVNDWMQDELFPKYMGVLFVDCAPGEVRKGLIKKYENVPVVVVHDTEPGAEYVYGLSEILSTFKYRLDYQPEGKPHTTAVSNFVDVTKWV